MNKKAKKAEFPVHLLKSSMNIINQKYANEYVEDLESQDLDEKTKVTYRLACERIFKYEGNWKVDFKDYTNETCDVFISEMLENEISKDRVNTYITVLNKMGIYFKENYPEEFHRNFLNKIERQQDNQSKNIPSRALNLYELEELKRFLLKRGNEKVAYTFAVYYYTGKKKLDYKFFDPNNAVLVFDDKNGSSLVNGYFELNGDRVEISNEIWLALREVRIKGMKKYTEHMVVYHFEKITSFMHEKGFYLEGQTFTHDDIRKTRDKYFMKCPCCQSMFENTTYNWVIVNIENSENNYLLCKKCKGKNDA